MTTTVRGTVATVIDNDAKLGLGYPCGLLECGDRPGRLLRIRQDQDLLAFQGDQRYRPRV
jgi:hypothetical protein